MMFTANGTENDHDQSNNNCAEMYLAPYWYNKCSESRLTGEYGMIVHDEVVNTGSWLDKSTITFSHGILWYSYLGGDEHPQFVDMKIRPV